MMGPMHDSDARDEDPWVDSLPFALWRAHTLVNKRVSDTLEGTNVTVTQIGMCVQLDAAGELSGSDLARRLRITPQSVTTALGRLESLGWVTRAPHPTHGRVILYRLTAAGESGVADGRARIGALNDELSDLLGAREQAALIESLTRSVRLLDG